MTRRNTHELFTFRLKYFGKSDVQILEGFQPEKRLVRLLEGNVDFRDELSTRSAAARGSITRRDRQRRSKHLFRDDVAFPRTRQGPGRENDGDRKVLGTTAQLFFRVRIPHPLVPTLLIVVSPHS